MKSITVQELRERVGVPLIDVREPEEYAAGRVPGAVSLPMSQIGDLLDQLPDGAFDVICAWSRHWSLADTTRRMSTAAPTPGKAWGFLSNADQFAEQFVSRALSASSTCRHRHRLEM